MSLLKILLAGGVLAFLLAGLLLKIGEHAEQQTSPDRISEVTVQARVVSPGGMTSQKPGRVTVRTAESER